MFTPIETSIGALLLHLATTTLLFDGGLILGASGLIRQLFQNPKQALTTPAPWFFFGMAIATVLVKRYIPESVPVYPDLGGNFLTVVANGLLTGLGTKYCGGCTSGHMLCGIGQLRPRSILATAIFFPTAMITFHLTNPSLETLVCPAGGACYEPAIPARSEITKLGSVLLLIAALVQLNQLRLVGNREFGRKATILLSGSAFGLGLLVSGMASPSKVQGFFAIRFSPFDLKLWDPSLMLVILFGVIPNVAHFLYCGLEGSPTFADGFSLPIKTVKDVDTWFVLGAVVFGVSWGLTGVCPGPAMLRTFLQPSWGVLWMVGFYAGSVDWL